MKPICCRRHNQPSTSPSAPEFDRHHEPINPSTTHPSTPSTMTMSRPIHLIICFAVSYLGLAISVRGQDPGDIAAWERQQFLEEHNKVRAHAREPLLEWDEKLEQYARGYAEERREDCRLVHSQTPYGENIFWGGGNMWTVKDIVRAWVREHRFYNRISSVCEPGKVCGHYTQIVWRDTRRIGCARTQCNNGDIFSICSYDPPGNYIGENPFEDHQRS